MTKDDVVKWSMGCGVHAYFLLEWHLVMNPQEAREFGQRLRDRRESLGLTVRQVSDAAKVPHSTVARVERGEFAAPRPDKLAKLATALGFSPAELFAAAGYVRADELPDLATYLKAKFAGLSPSVIDELGQQFDSLTAGEFNQAKLATEEVDNDAAGESH